MTDQAKPVPPTYARLAPDRRSALAADCYRHLLDLTGSILFAEEQAYREVDLQVRDLEFLEALSGARELTARQLAAGLRKAIDVVAAHLESLENRRLIQRQPKGAHARFALTVYGAAVYRAAVRTREAILDTRLGALEIADLQQLDGLLERLIG